MRHPLSILFLISLVQFSGLASAGWDEGVAAFRSGDYDRAVQEFESVVDSQPDFAAGHFILARAHLHLGDTTEALTHYRRASELEPRNVSYQFELARAYLVNNRDGEAARLLEQIDPSSLPSAQQEEYREMLGQAMEDHTRTDDSHVQSEVDPHDSRIEEENRRIAEENRKIEQENARIEAMRREREALERELEEVEDGDGSGR